MTTDPMTFMRAKYLVPLFIFSVILYDFLNRQVVFKTFKGFKNSSTLDEGVKHSTATLNLNRIKMFYMKNNDFFIPSSLTEKDWHDYAQIEYEKLRSGLGEQGVSAALKIKEIPHDNNLLVKYGYNVALSTKISLNRSLPDTRHKDCQSRRYLENLPTVSIIVSFYNEHWTTLLRTIFSILNRTPPQLIKEIFLIDDGSSKASIKQNLDKYIKENIPRVKVIHLPNHNGPVATRMAGAKVATGDVLVFMDSHSEVNVNWLPPLLEPIALDYRTVVIPILDTVAYDTFEYRSVDDGARGSFDWGMTFRRLSMIPKDDDNKPEPFETPVMMGGMFAISRHFFWELGGYDPELRIWGGEQFEISFKIWQCGGRMLEAPCSRVGHVYKIYDPPGYDAFASRNYRRVAEVWMDEYAQYVYARRPGDKKVDPGDLTEQKALRKKLKCKPFRWFLTQIAFDLTQQFPLVDPLPYAEGQIRPKINRHMCVDGLHGKWNDPFQLRPCYPKETDMPKEENEQMFELTWFNDVKLKSRHICWEFKDWLPGSHVSLYPCHHKGGNQQWRYYEDMKRFVYIGSLACLDHNPNNQDLFLNLCDDNSETQLWEIDVIFPERMALWNVSNALSVTGPTEEWKE